MLSQVIKNITNTWRSATISSMVSAVRLFCTKIRYLVLSFSRLQKNKKVERNGTNNAYIVCISAVLFLTSALFKSNRALVSACKLIARISVFRESRLASSIRDLSAVSAKKTSYFAALISFLIPSSRNFFSWISPWSTRKSDGSDCCCSSFRSAELIEDCRSAYRNEINMIATRTHAK